jgi:hypothetical protein
MLHIIMQNVVMYVGDSNSSSSSFKMWSKMDLLSRHFRHSRETTEDQVRINERQKRYHQFPQTINFIDQSNLFHYILLQPAFLNGRQERGRRRRRAKTAIYFNQNLFSDKNLFIIQLVVLCDLMFSSLRWALI